MMNFTLYDPGTGEVAQTGSCPDDDFELQARDGLVLLEGRYLPENFYWNGEQMVTFPPRPSVDHCWCWVTKTWVGDIEVARARLTAAIEAERDRRLVAPVLVYDGKNLDADARAKQNLGDVLDRVRCLMNQGEEMPAEEMVWKDHDNLVHVFPDMVSYLDWLEGYVIAFGARNTAAWTWSWQKKAELAAVADLGELQQFTL